MGAHATIEAETIEKMLRELDDLPLAVHAFRAEVGLDWTDAPAVWVSVVLEDDDTPFEPRQEVRERIRHLVADLAGGAAEWVYVQFSAASEEQVA